MPTLEEIKRKLQELQNKTKKQKDIWKPKDKHVIRFLPYKHGAEPFMVIGFHYDIGNQSILCPKYNFGDDCSICDLAERLRSWKDEEGNDKSESLRKQEWELFKKIQVKERYMAPMVERGQEADGAKWYSFPEMIQKKLMGYCVNEEMREMVGASDEDGFAPLVNPELAFDITLDFQQANNKDNKGNAKTFPVTEIDKKMKPTKLMPDKKAAQALIDSVKSIFDVYPRVMSEDVKRALDKFMNSSAPVDDGTKDDGKEYQHKSNSAEKPIENGLSIDEAFNEMTDE